MRISDWSSDVCSSDLRIQMGPQQCSAFGADHLFRRHVQQHRAEQRLGNADAAQDEVLPRRFQTGGSAVHRSEEHTSELQSLMRTSYAVFCLKKKNKSQHNAEG